MHEYGKMQGLPATQWPQSGVGVGVLAGAQNIINQPPPNPATLVGAISSSESLMHRIGNLNAQVEQLASQIGGPWPKNDEGRPRPDNPPAMVALNDNIDTCHVLVSRLEQSLAAIARNLGV